MNPNQRAPRARAANPAGALATRAALALAFVTLASAYALAQPAQDAAAQQKPDDVAGQKADEVTNAPPPMLYLPEEVRRRLEGEGDLKARTHLALDLAEERLARAAQQADADRFEEATAELGVYEALVADAVRSVQSSGRSKGKQRDILKRVEMTLRSHVPRIETIRRELPAAHAAYFKSAIEFVNEQRDLALNTFYDDTVIRERKDKAAVGERANSTGPAAPDNEKKPDQH
jgi:hypothetical protein